MAKIRLRSNEDVTICPFPKHKGRPWADVIEDDRPYAEWCISGEGPEMSSRMYDHLTDLLEVLE